MVEAGEEQRQDCSSGTEETTEDSTRPGQEEPFGPARGMCGLKGGWAQTQGHLRGQGYMLSSVVNKAIIVPAHVQSILISIIKFNPHSVSESFPRFTDETAGAQGTAGPISHKQSEGNRGKTPTQTVSKSALRTVLPLCAQVTPMKHGTERQGWKAV